MNKEQYDRARKEFEELRTEDKAVFLVEAVASTVARGVEQIGRAIADEFDRAFKNRSESSGTESHEKANGNGAAAPETPPM